MTKLIAVGNMKGGVAKTTTSIHLAQHLGDKGKTLLLDADEELQCALEWRSGDYDGWTFEAKAYAEVKPQEMQQYDYLVLDTKGNEQSLVELAESAELLIIPTKPDGVSAGGLIRTLTPLVQAGATNYRVLMTANQNGRGEELREALAGQDIPVFNSIIRHSTAVGDASDLHVPLDGYKKQSRGGYTNSRYAKLVSLDYAALTREVLSYVN